MISHGSLSDVLRSQGQETPSMSVVNYHLWWR